MRPFPALRPVAAVRLVLAAPLAAWLVTHAADAETPLSGAEFEATVTGQTLSFAVGGQAYGVEQYLPGRRVVWAFEGGPCREGIWYEETPGRICFVYEHEPGAQCWQFFRDAGGLRARFEGASPDQDLIEVGKSPRPLACPGPEVGV